ADCITSRCAHIIWFGPCDLYPCSTGSEGRASDVARTIINGFAKFSDSFCKNVGQVSIYLVLKNFPNTMRKKPVTRRQFLGSGIAAAGAISIGGALPANAREWEEYAARFDRSVSDALPAEPLRPD